MQQQQTHSFLFGIFFFLLFLLYGSNSYGQTYLLKNATILSGEDAVSSSRKGSVLVANGRIAEIYEENPVNVPQYVQVIDCTGKYVTAGLIDAHVHLATINLQDRQKAEDITDGVLINMIRQGITTVRDMSGDAPYLADYQKLTASGEKLGPDIFYSARFVGPQYFAMARIAKSEPWDRLITDTTDIKEAVRQAKACGATGIKLYAEISQKLYDIICEEAAKQNVLIWSHATIYPIKPINAIKKNVKSLSHAADIIFQQLGDDEVNVSLAWKKFYQGMILDSAALDPVFEKMIRNEVMLDPTLFHASNNKLYHAITIARWAYEKGVKIVAGTDWPYSEQNDEVPLCHEALLLQDSVGLSASAVLASLTVHGAAAMALTDRGVVEVGKRADLLILGKNPLEDLNALFQPDAVLKNGNLIKASKEGD